MSLLFLATSDSNRTSHNFGVNSWWWPRWRIYLLVNDVFRFHHDSLRDTISWESQHASQQNVAIQVFGSQCSPRSALFAHDLNRHGFQRGAPIYHEVFRLQRWSLCFHERNVFGRLLARDLHHGKQRSPLSIMVWIWVWLVGNFLNCWTTCPACGRWATSGTQFFHPVMFQGNLWRRPRWHVYLLV